MILVMKMLGSSPTWGLSVPPAMLKPRPELPCGSRIVQGHRSAVEGGHRMVDRLEMQMRATHSLQGDLFVLNLPLRPIHLSDKSLG